MSSPSLIADNRTARHRYFIIDSLTAGIVLKGTEVKAAREGKVQLRDAFVRVIRGEAWLVNCHIGQYSHGNQMNHEPERSRKLLLKRSEIRKFAARVEQKGLTMVPLKLFLNKGLIKVDVGICKGKEAHDKRASIKKRETDREMARALRGRE